MTRSALALFAASLAASCGRAPTPPPEPAVTLPVPVRTAPVERIRHAPALRTTGVLAGKEELRLSFKLGGIVDRVLVDEGATVRPGQVLATLKMPEVSAAVTQARRGLEKAERDLARVRELFAGKAATLEQLQNATTAVDLAAAGAAGATFNEDHASIRAPAAGKILRRLAEHDELVTAGAPVLILRAHGRGWVLRAGVSDRDVVRVSLGDRASLTFDALPDRSFTATVSEIAEGATPVTGSYELELRVDPAAAPLRSGLIARAVIAPATTALRTFVPLEALQEGDGSRAIVFVPGADGTRAERRAVTIAYLDGGRAAIASGLDGVTAVVTDGAARLVAGAAIETVRRPLTAERQP
jgi:membrane fusion protein, multidrug efflux system